MSIQEVPEKPEREKRNIWLALPCHGMTITTLTSKCIMNDIMPLIGRGDTVRVFDEMGHADLYLLRAQIVARFLEDKSATHLVMIDSDVGWGPYGLLKLLDNDADVVAGAYPKRQYPISFMFRTKEAGKLTGDMSTGLMDVLGMPGGFMAIKRHVLEKMTAHYAAELGCFDWMAEATETLVRLFDPYWYTGPDGKRRVLAEDYAFCQRWIDMGGKVYMDAAIPMGHIGQHVFSGCVGEMLNADEDKSDDKEKAA